MTRDEMDEIKRHFESATAETRRHFDVVAEGLSAQIRLVAEGRIVLAEKLERVDVGQAAFSSTVEGFGGELAALSSKVGHVDDRLGRVDARLEQVESGVQALRSESTREFAELRAMLKLSYAELEGRVTRLEGALADVVGRLERLEKRTHA